MERYYPTYLIHHGVKGQQWGIRRFQNEDGSLTAEGRSRYGLSKLNYKEKYTKRFGAQRALKKEYRRMLGIVNNSELARGKVYESDDEAEKRYQNDIRNASKDKKFVSDWKKATKDVMDVLDKNGDWIGKEDKVMKDLMKKHPKHKELIYGFSPHEKFSRKGEVNNWLKTSKNPVSDILNYDYYYEPKVYDLDKKTSQILAKSAEKELTKYFINKYGKENVDALYRKVRK